MLLRLLVIVAVLAALWYVVRAVRSAGGVGALLGSGGEVTFTPVEELPAAQRQVIDDALSRGRLGPAVQHYRAATGSGEKQAQAAVDTYRWRQGGADAS